MAHKALDQRDVDHSGRVPATPANDPDILRIDLQKCLQPFNPLDHQLTSMDKNEGIARPASNEGSRHDGLAESRRGRQYTKIMRSEGLQRPRLLIA